ncbi:MAG: hypothetical protein KAW00_06225 [Dehalococcoidia bacterium]|nr:hypothetical protein [Dehalococcoidia bacterium]
MEKIVSLCGGCGQCPVVKVTGEQVEIGEKDNTCVLTKEQWETLKEKIVKKELQGRKTKESNPIIKPHPLLIWDGFVRVGDGIKVHAQNQSSRF